MLETENGFASLTIINRQPPWIIDEGILTEQEIELWEKEKLKYQPGRSVILDKRMNSFP